MELKEGSVLLVKMTEWVAFLFLLSVAEEVFAGGECFFWLKRVLDRGPEHRE
jgi:hypothetical protein